MADLTLGELFAGVGGFSLGFETEGYRTRWQAEIDPHCQQVLARHWPDAVRYGDVTGIDGAAIEPVDVVTFGSPCQDLSVAGKRAGLGGARSGLFFEATRIIKEMRDATVTFPRWAVWENVPGALTSNRGHDFAAALDALDELRPSFVEWAVVDARWLGVPQRRRRLFVVACLDPAAAGRSPDPLLPVSPRSGWHPPTSTAQGEGDPRRTPSSPRGDIAVARKLAHGHYAIDDTGSTIRARKSMDETDIVLSFDSTFSTHSKIDADVSPTIKIGSGLGIASPPAAMVDSVLRRLTPLECERAMGWPDEHTRYRADGTEQFDSARYKQCGNGVTAVQAAWIARQLRKADQ